MIDSLWQKQSIDRPNGSHAVTGHVSGNPDDRESGLPDQDRPLLLIVDDNQINLDMLSRRLQRKGYNVMTADSASQAQQLVQTRTVHLLLLDINMPDMNGYEFCSWLKINDRLKDIPVIFLSARAETIDKVRAFDCGGIDYLTKPIQMEELYVRVETHLKLRRIQSELEDKNEELQRAMDQLQTTQMQLVQSEKMAALGVLTAGLAHEINNPVNYILASARGLDQAIRQIRELLVLYDRIDPENAESELNRLRRIKQETNFTGVLDDVNEMVKNISSGSERTADIVRGLRSFSRLDNSNKVIVDIHAIINSVLVILQHRIGNTIAIRKDYGNIPPVPGFPGRLDQVFMNLLANAIDASNIAANSEKNRVIRIMTRTMDKAGHSVVAIAIADEGPGIADEVRAHIFEPFYTTKDVGEGTGLGLAISLGIVESHGGTIESESVPGKGATFTVYLPLADVPEARILS